ncbi:MAG TPA: potassium transporter TrkG, partial [Nitrolancea sp.]|nr:potassium transporter TrkG [Nitrolancea sp.]
LSLNRSSHALTMAEPPEQPPRAPIVRHGGETRAGRRPGDRRVRVASRPPTARVTLPKLGVQNPRLSRLSPAGVFVLGFAAFILAGTLLLILPISSATGQWSSPLDALFTATSAVCVTGLIVQDTGTYWSLFGQVVIIALIQLGGLGFMTSSTLLLLLIGRRAGLRHRMIQREAIGGEGLGSTLTLTRQIALFTLGAEALGAVILTASFWDDVGPQRAVWWGIFHAISAFNNAGFDLIGGFRSLVPFNQEPAILLTVAVLIILGGISFAVVADFYENRHAIWKRRSLRLALDTRLVLLTTAGLLVFGTLTLLFTEWTNPATFGALNFEQRLLNAFFHSVSARSAGFTAVEIGSMREDSLLILVALMFIGGSATSTAGGIKVQTFSLLFFAIVSSIRGSLEVESFQRRVPTTDLLRAISIALLAIFLIFVATTSLSQTEPFKVLPVLFESVSALGTTGWTTGITTDLTAGGRWILIVAMFVGRLGPLTLFLALAARERPQRYQWPEERVKLG